MKFDTDISLNHDLYHGITFSVSFHKRTDREKAKNKKSLKKYLSKAFWTTSKTLQRRLILVYKRLNNSEATSSCRNTRSTFTQPLRLTFIGTLIVERCGFLCDIYEIFTLKQNLLLTFRLINHLSVSIESCGAIKVHDAMG